MDYAAPADLIARFGLAEIVDLTDRDNIPPSRVDEARVGVKLGDAQAFVDGYVGQAWRLPLVGCERPLLEPGAAPVRMPPPLLTRLVCDVARYYLHDDLAPENEVYRRFVAARKELEAIAAGTLLLSCPWGGQPGEPLGVDAAGAGEVRWQFCPRQITDDSLRGFA